MARTRSVTKQELARVVSELIDVRYDSFQGPAYKAVRAIQRVITEALLRGERVSIAGFGIFEIVERPKTRHAVRYFYGNYRNKKLTIKNFPSKKYVKFKPSKALLRFINGNSK